MKSYSQMQQDIILDEELFHGSRDGYFVEVGAVDGLHFSNTLFFEKHRNWKGICVEPNPIEFKKMMASERQCIMENVAISDGEGEVDFLAIDGYGKGLSGIIDSYDERHLKRIDRDVEGHDSERHYFKVKTLSLKGLFEKYDVNEVDFLSIDVEGAELKVLESIDFSKVKIRSLMIENNYGVKDERRFLKQKGYGLWRKIKWDEVYVLKSDPAFGLKHHLRNLFT